MSASLDDLTPDTRDAADRLIAYALDRGWKLNITFTKRTCEEQNALYASGRTMPGPIVTNARGCVSWHVHGRALDAYLPKGATEADYATLGAFWKQLGGYWGGDFPGLKDLGHFEYHPGVHIEEVCIDPANCVTAPYPGSSEPGGPTEIPLPSGGSGGGAIFAGLFVFAGVVVLGGKALGKW